MIYQITQYENEKGWIIQKLTGENGFNPAGQLIVETKYRGIATLTFQNGAAQQFQFEIEADSIQQAYERFEGAAMLGQKVALGKIQQAAIKQALTAPAKPPLKILNGRN